MEILCLNIQLISGWIGSKTKIDVQKVLGQRERSETQFSIQGHVAGKFVCVCVCVCFGETAAL